MAETFASNARKASAQQDQDTTADPVNSVDPADPSEPVEGAAHNDRVEQAFPWLASFLLHLGLFVLLLFGVLIAKHVIKKKAHPIIIPMAMNSPYTKHPGGIPNPGTKEDPLHKARQQEKKLLNAHGFAQHMSVSAATLLNGTGGKNLSSMIAVGSTGGASDTAGVGGSGGALASFGVGGGGSGIGPQSNFMGVAGGNATRIVYVLDSSGFMVDIFDIVKRKAIRSIENLQPIQRFAVITFSDHYKFIGPTHLVRATSRTKRMARRGLKAVLAQGADTYSYSKFYRPLRAAFALKPQLVYFLTDGRFNPKLVAAIRKINPGKRIRIVAYACIGRNAGKYLGGTGNNDFTLPQITKHLREIAEQSGGKFKVLSSKDFFGGS